MEGGLGQPGVAAVKWSAVSTAARFGLQLVAQVMLARTLGPEIFGIFALGMVVLTFANFVSGFGFSWSLMQRTTLHDEDIRFAWTWQVMVGAITMLAVYLAAPYIAAYFKEVRSQAVIEWLSLACLLAAAAGPATYLLQRDLNFRAVGLVQVGSYAAGYLCVGLPMALLGRGAESLVAAWLVQAGVMLIASYVLKPHPVRPLFWYAGARTAVGTGRAVFFTNIVNWVLNNMDRVLIGRLLDAHSLGLYNVAYNSATMPNTLLLGALQPAFLAAGARLQDDPQRLGRAYVQMIATVLVLAVPTFVFLALISPDLMRMLYGARWSEAGWVLGILFLGIPAYVIWGLSTPVLWNTGHKHYEAALQLPLILVGGLGFYMYAANGIQSAAVVTSLLLVLRALVIGAAALRALKLSVFLLVPHAIRGLLLSAVSALGGYAGLQATARFNAPLLSLMAATVIALAAVAVLLLLRPQILGAETAAMIIRFFPRLQGVFERAQLTPSPDALSEQRT
jgi:O-antigen/teichoic acid export membrane protein